MPNGKGMSKEERTAWSIAKAFTKAVERLENFTGDPDLVYEDLKYEARRGTTDKRVSATLDVIRKAVSE